MRIVTGILFLLCSVHLLVAGEPVRYWVFFTDKNPDSKDVASINPASLLSKKALHRRQLRTPSANLTFSDLPLSLDYIRQLESLGIKIHQKSHWLNAVSCYLNDIGKDQLERFAFVKSVVPVRSYRRFDRISGSETVPLLKADSSQYGPSLNQTNMLAIPSAHAEGLYGQDILIAVFDTGFILDHEAFKNIQIVDTWDFIHNDRDVGNDAGDLQNQHNHGSEVLAVLAGYQPGNIIGPAYGARFLLAKTEDLRSESHQEEDNWVAAAEWAERAGADIITTSVGYDYSVGYSYEDMDGNSTIITRAADLAAKKGVAVFSTAGNEGLTAWRYIIAPADGDSVIAVGGVRADRSYWPNSSQGPTYDDRIKPDLVAQAQQVYTIKPGTLNEYQYVSGTSYSCPLVTGAGAILLSAVPFLTPVALRDTLRQYASNNKTPNNYIGSGIVDLEEVIVHVLKKPGVKVSTFTGTPGPGRNTLIWTVEREIGNDKWLVRRREGGESYRMITEVESIESAPDIRIYSYVDFDVRAGTSFSYRLSALLQSGEEVFVDSTVIQSLKPVEMSLVNNFPNPFNDRTHLIFGLSSAQLVSLKIYNNLGQLTKTLIDDLYLTADYHQITWDATNDSGEPVGSGSYYVRLRTDSGQKAIKIIYIK
jgi:hypothetical protein